MVVESAVARIANVSVLVLDTREGSAGVRLQIPHGWYGVVRTDVTHGSCGGEGCGVSCCVLPWRGSGRGGALRGFQEAELTGDASILVFQLEGGPYC